MTQVLVKVLEKEAEKIDEPETLGDLNPKFFEEATNFEEAKEKIRVSDIYAGSKYNLFSTF